MPFHALYDGAGYLTDRFEITVTPTATAEGGPPPHRLHPPQDVHALWTCIHFWTCVHLGRASAPGPGPAHGLTPGPPRPALVVGVPDAAAPAVEAEARAVAASLPGARLLLGEEATSAAFAAAAPAAAHIHLACHGIYRPSNPLFSRLRLADRWVTSAEILQYDLTGALVVLSACESAQQGQAAEPVGLGWAFLAAGAAGVVASQWMVHDRSAAEFMSELYRRLSAGDAPPTAVRAAGQRVRQTHPHPYFWAPFSYVAAPGSTERNQP